MKTRHTLVGSKYNTEYVNGRDIFHQRHLDEINNLILRHTRFIDMFKKIEAFEKILNFNYLQYKNTTVWNCTTWSRMMKYRGWWTVWAVSTLAVWTKMFYGSLAYLYREGPCISNPSICREWKTCNTIYRWENEKVNNGFCASM